MMLKVEKTKGVIPAIICCFVIVVLTVGFLSGCGGGSRPNELLIAVEELPSGLDPVLDLNEAGRMTAGIVFQGLFDPTGEKANDFRPALATEISQNPENRAIYDISLQTGVVWHDGQRFSADDVLFSYQCYISLENNSPLRGRIASMIDTLEKVGDHQIRVTFSVPVSPIDVPFLLSFKIIPSAYQGHPMEINRGTATSLAFNRNPIGTGSYKFESWQSNQVSLIKADPTAQIERITLQRQRDIDVRVKKLVDDKIDLIFDVDPSYFEILQKNQLEYREYLPYAYYAIAFNLNDSLISDTHLRRAMAQATDRKALLEETFRVEWEEYINNGPFPHNSHRLYQDFEGLLKFDIDKAKEELLMNQYAGQSLSLIYQNEHASIGEQIAYGFKNMMEKIGVQVEVIEKGLDFYSNLKSGEYQIALVYQDDFDRHYNILPIYLTEGPQNITGIQDAELDELLKQWSNTIVMTEKVPIAAAIHRKISDICPYAFLFTPPQRAYFSKRLQRVHIADTNSLLANVHKWGIMLHD